MQQMFYYFVVGKYFVFFAFSTSVDSKCVQNDFVFSLLSHFSSITLYLCRSSVIAELSLPVVLCHRFATFHSCYLVVIVADDVCVPLDDIVAKLLCGRKFQNLTKFCQYQSFFCQPSAQLFAFLLI